MALLIAGVVVMTMMMMMTMMMTTATFVMPLTMTKMAATVLV